MTLKTEITIEQASEFLGKIKGEYIWGLNCAEGNVLKAEFGDPFIRVHALPTALG